jgi:hypothetical protein
MERLDFPASRRLVKWMHGRRVGLIACALGLSFGTAVRAQTNITTKGDEQRQILHPFESVSITTYHGDPQRTGWNPRERILTPSNVTPTTFGLIAAVALDGQVDAQPLVVADQNIEGQGIHNVVYVTTENDSVYAIDGSTGNILTKANFGPSVPDPDSCGSIPYVGITSTPTIDVRKQTIYAMAYTTVAGQPSYQLHALDLQTLQDEPGSPVTVSASHSLADGSEFNFNPMVQRQRPALLESDGKIYAAFGSFCDFSASTSRGWLLGWNAGTLTPLESNTTTSTSSGRFCDPGWLLGLNFGTPLCSNELTDTLITAPTVFGTNWFLSSIWMSGYGVAADRIGNVFFVTGNSDPDINTYTGTTNIQESVVKMPPALTSVVDLFTPSNVFFLDQGDRDFSGGGVMVLPGQPGPVPRLAVAAGKHGLLYIMNRDDMGGFHNPDIAANVEIGGCWCGPSYYQGSDGVGRVVSSGGIPVSGGGSQSTIETWTVNTSQTPALSLEAASSALAVTPQDPGFFTTISSNWTKPNTAIIWAIGRPTGPDNHITLYAFNGTKSGRTMPLLWSGNAGFWPNIYGNANLVPTVANGMVYVGSYRQLAIFGLTSSGAQTGAKLQHSTVVPELQPAGAVFWGTVKSIDGSRIALVLRTGESLEVDLSEALAQGTTIAPLIGENVVVNGELDENGVLEARFMSRAKAPQSWGTDSRG